MRGCWGITAWMHEWRKVTAKHAGKSQFSTRWIQSVVRREERRGWINVMNPTTIFTSSAMTALNHCFHPHHHYFVVKRWDARLQWSGIRWYRNHLEHLLSLNRCSSLFSPSAAFPHFSCSISLCCSMVVIIRFLNVFVAGPVLFDLRYNVSGKDLKMFRKTDDSFFYLKEQVF